MSVGSDPGSSIASGSPDAGAIANFPVKQVRLLLPVWGEPFIVQFMNVCLPTLLAPGNIPAVAAELPCTFVFLTNTEGAEMLQAHPAVDAIRRFCTVEFDIIDNLITGDNYSTTLTLGYARAIRSVGPSMRETCFFFLISDYIMADGSLSRVLARVRSGYTGVLAGNFQVVEEDAIESLFKMYDTDEPAVSIDSRDLVSWALGYLHPMTLANTVNFPIYHSVHSNRLFWRVGDTAMIGRFYLMHMIAIQPEIADFEIGASCDYSFIPEMCPSGNVHVVSDSDEYLVVEMQSRGHEAGFIRLGPTTASALALSLAEWTTERHRLNAHTAVVYRAAALPAGLSASIEESRAFVENIESQLPAPMPFRDHPYWLGAIAAHRRAVRERAKKKGENLEADDVDRKPMDFQEALYGLRNLLFGRPSRLRPWHPRWPDYRAVQQLAVRFLVKPVAGKSLIVSNSPADFRGLLEASNRSDDSLRFRDLLECTTARYKRFMGQYDGCLLILRDNELHLTHDLLSQIKPLLSVNDYIVVFITNGAGLGIGEQFNNSVLQAAGRFFDRHFKLESVEFVSAGWLSWGALRIARDLFAQGVQNPFALLFWALPMTAILGISIFSNLLRRQRQQDSTGLCSSVTIALKIVEASTERPMKINSQVKQSYLRYIPKLARPLRPSRFPYVQQP